MRKRGVADVSAVRGTPPSPYVAQDGQIRNVLFVLPFFARLPTNPNLALAFLFDGFRNGT